MPKARAAAHRGQDLSVAPADLRCSTLIRLEDGSQTRCSRFSIRLKSGERDTCCISHSSHPEARLLRSKGTRAREEAMRVESERRAGIADTIFPRVWRNRSDVQKCLLELSHAIVRGDVSPNQAKVLLAILREASAPGNGVAYV